VEFRPIRGRFGCEVVGVDPTLAVDDASFAAIEQAWFAHSFLLFRGLTMNPAQHVAFTRRLGELHVMTPPQFNLPGMPEVFVVSNAVGAGASPRKYASSSSALSPSRSTAASPTVSLYTGSANVRRPDWNACRKACAAVMGSSWSSMRSADTIAEMVLPELNGDDWIWARAPLTAERMKNCCRSIRPRSARPSVCHSLPSHVW